MSKVGAEVRTSSKQEREERLPKKEFQSMTITPGEEGGVSVEHHFTHYEHKPEMHPFGASEGKEFVAHVLKHTGMKVDGLELEHESEDDNEKEKVAPKK